MIIYRTLPMMSHQPQQQQQQPRRSLPTSILTTTTNPTKTIRMFCRWWHHWCCTRIIWSVWILLVMGMIMVVPISSFQTPQKTDIVFANQHTRNIRIVQLFSTKSDSSSSSSNNNNIDDELSKLIGKREQIKKNVKKRSDVMEENLQSSTEPVVNLDLDTLPEFKTQRPIRSSTNNKEDADDDDDNDNDGKNKSKKTTKGSSSSTKDAPPIIDYLADYDDENEFHIPNRIGISTMCWGDPTYNFVVGKNVKLTKRQLKYGSFVAGDVQLAYQALLASGITFIETSPTYGIQSLVQGMSAEQLLGQCIQQHPSDLPECQISTSSVYSPYKSLLLRGSINLSKTMVNDLEQSLVRLSGMPSSSIKKNSKDDDTDNDNDTSSSSSSQLSTIDLFTIKCSSIRFPTSILAASLASQIESGQANYIGVQGITSGRQLRKLCQLLREKYDTTLTTNMFEYSLTNTKHEELIQICKENNVIPLICNPLDDGLATGIYTASNPAGGSSSSTSSTSIGRINNKMKKNQKFTFQQLEKLQPLHSVQETVAERVRVRVSRSMGTTQERFKSKFGPPPKINTDITTTQIALQYIIAKGGVPLPICNTPNDVKEISGCLGWTLTDDEVNMLDAAIALCKI